MSTVQAVLTLILLFKILDWVGIISLWRESEFKIKLEQGECEGSMT